MDLTIKKYTIRSAKRGAAQSVAAIYLTFKLHRAINSILSIKNCSIIFIFLFKEVKPLLTDVKETKINQWQAAASIYGISVKLLFTKTVTINKYF